MIFSCEKDDFCTENPVTPNLVIKFNNFSDTDKTKKTDSLSVWATGKKDSIYKKVSLDSIAIPLNSITEKTVYNFSKGKDSISKITIFYEPKEKFVSRSCGYKVIFNNVKLSKENSAKSWIDSLSTKEIETINNQENAHITFYH